MRKTQRTAGGGDAIFRVNSPKDPVRMSAGTTSTSGLTLTADFTASNFFVCGNKAAGKTSADRLQHDAPLGVRCGVIDGMRGGTSMMVPGLPMTIPGMEGTEVQQVGRAANGPVTNVRSSARTGTNWNCRVTS